MVLRPRSRACASGWTTSVAFTRPHSVPQVGLRVPSRSHLRAFARPNTDQIPGEIREPSGRAGAYPNDEASPRGGRSCRAGTPATVSPAGTSVVTTAPAPTRAPRPIRTPPRITLPDPRLAPCSTIVRRSVQSSAVFRRPSAVVARGHSVVDEEHAVPHEDLVLDLDSLADEAVALDLATRADARASLNLDERADSRAGADRATVEIGERGDVNVVPEGDPVEQPVRRVVGRPVSHRRRRARRPRPPRAGPR